MVFIPVAWLTLLTVFIRCISFCRRDLNYWYNVRSLFFFRRGLHHWHNLHSLFFFCRRGLRTVLTQSSFVVSLSVGGVYIIDTMYILCFYSCRRTLLAQSSFVVFFLFAGVANIIDTVFIHCVFLSVWVDFISDTMHILFFRRGLHYWHIFLF